MADPDPSLVSHLVTLVGGGVGVKLVERLMRKDQHEAEQRAETIRKLWAQNDGLWAEVREMQERLEECREHHRECQSNTERLEGQLGDLRQELDELKTRVEANDGSVEGTGRPG